MSELSKQALVVDNNQSFPNNNNGAITPSVLRAFNTNMIDSTVNQTQYTSDSASFNTRINAITGSGGTINTGSFAITGSNTFVGNQTISGSLLLNGSEVNMTSSLMRFSTTGTGSITFAAGGTIRFQGNTDFTSPIRTTFVNVDNSGSNGYYGFNAETEGRIYQDFSGSVNARILAITGSGGGTISLQDEGSILGNATSFNFNGAGVSATLSAGTASITIPGGGGSIDTGSFAITGSNTFTGNQIISQSVGMASLSLAGSETALDLTGSNSYIRNAGVLWFRNQLNSVGQFRETNFVMRNSQINFGADNGFIFSRTNGVDSVNTSVGGVKMNTVSGSLVLSAMANSVTTGSLLHLSCSSNSAFVNLVFKNNDNTADTIISGSNNIFINPAPATTAGFKRYIGNNNMFLPGPFVPQITASMQFSPTMNGNIGGVYNIRGPISASLMQVNNNVSANGVIQIGIPGTPTQNAERLSGATSVSNNIVAGTLTLVANQAEISGTTNVAGNNVNGGATLNAFQSALTFNNNIVNDSNFILTNLFFSSSAGIGQIAASRNNIAGQSNQIIISGSQPSGSTSGTSYSDNFIGGGSNILFGNVAAARVSGTIAYHSAVRNMIFGNLLIVSASSALTDQSSHGSAFFGRWNVNDGIRNKTSDIILAVGTGTSTTRKTGFLIDSGSNTFVEGTFNVSGSLTVQSGSTFFANGNKQFNVGAFSSLVTQSGSAGVSQSVNFEVTDKSEGVSIASNSQITLANSGTYSITFSAQIKADGGQDTIWMWLKKNGTNVANTSTKLIGKNGEETVLTVNYVVDAVANDYYELAWENLNGHADLLFEGASGNYPAIPSIILTVTQVR